MISPTLAWTGWALTTLTVAKFRSRIFTAFAGVLLAINTLIWTQLFLVRHDLSTWITGYLLIMVYLHILSLMRPSLRPPGFRWWASLPGLTFTGGSVLAIPWVVLDAVGVTPYGWWVPFGLAVFGASQSLLWRTTSVMLTLDGQDLGPLARWRSPKPIEDCPLRIFQITDPHLGPFMSATQLRRLCERAVAAEPDLVLITGDLLTMDAHGHPELLAEGLAPLSVLKGQVFACYGNHDYEAPETVNEGLARVGIALLVDQATWVDTPIGRVQIVGADFRHRDRAQHLEELFQAIPPAGDALRILMLHDPGAFQYVPDGAAALTLSGHTHGGQVGLVSLGLNWTIVGALTQIPDHGMWAQGTNRLYVHRGQGHYGYPIRLGVPVEESVLEVHF